jgi:cystathionine beta-lyase/cystathionine gamma-synthase
LPAAPETVTRGNDDAGERAKLGLSDTLVRLSPGCEHHRDLVIDLLDGLSALDSTRSGDRVELAV